MMTINNKKVGFLSICRFPHPIAKDIMTISRLVILPEFQGLGLGLRFMSEIKEYYKKDRIRITTSLKPFIKALSKSKYWKCVRFGRVSKAGEKSMYKNRDSLSVNRITATFEMRKYG